MADNQLMEGYLLLKQVIQTYPDCCHDWDGVVDHHHWLTPFGAALQNVYLLTDPNKEVPIEDSWFDDNVVKLEELRQYTKLSEQDFRQQTLEYRQVVNRRAAIITELVEAKGEYWKVMNLSEQNRDMWGSKRQYAFGKQLTQSLKEYGWTSIILDPIFGSLCFPTGGIVGPGNSSMFVGNIRMPLVIHAVVHDAFGYLLNYHKVGPGFNYMNTWLTAYKTDNPLCCQMRGLLCARYVVSEAQCTCKAGDTPASEKVDLVPIDIDK